MSVLTFIAVGALTALGAGMGGETPLTTGPERPETRPVATHDVPARSPSNGGKRPPDGYGAPDTLSSEGVVDGPTETERLVGMPLGFAALAVEREAGADVSAAARALTEAISAARPRLPASTPLAALEVIAEAASVACPTVVGGNGAGLISGALRDGECDCDVLVVVYLTVADVLGLPLSAVFLPDHALVVWRDHRSTVFWETTVPEERPGWLLEALVPDGATAYLRPQSRREMVGYLFHVRANHLMDRGAEPEALADYDRTSALNPTFMLAYSNRGRAHLIAERYDKALADYGHAIALDPTYGDALYGRGLALLALRRYREALEAFARVTAIDGAAADVLHAEGVAYGALGHDYVALERFDAALDLDRTLALAYEARGALHERRGDLEGARRDYEAFISLAAAGPARPLIPEVRRRLERLDPVQM